MIGNDMDHDTKKRLNYIMSQQVSTLSSFDVELPVSNGRGP